MTQPTFVRLNQGWNAEPNAPEPEVTFESDAIILRFYLNHQIYDCFSEEDVGALAFQACTRWRLGPTNDEGWYRGKCRYSRIAPAWGEFYEVADPDPLRDALADWHIVRQGLGDERHFLFYLRDETFECLAANWSFSLDREHTKKRAAAALAGLRVLECP